jgi:hypothetical protein
VLLKAQGRSQTRQRPALKAEKTGQFTYRWPGTTLALNLGVSDNSDRNAQVAYLIACSESLQDHLSHWRYTTNQLVEAFTALSRTLVTPVVETHPEMVSPLQQSVMQAMSGTEQVERGHVDLHQAIVKLLEVAQKLVSEHDSYRPDQSKS